MQIAFTDVIKLCTSLVFMQKLSCQNLIVLKSIELLPLEKITDIDS